MLTQMPDRIDEMVRVPAGLFYMGSETFYPEEAPIHRVMIDEFLIDATPVTNDEFAKFVDATGHKTMAEIAPRAEDYPGALPEMLYAGSLVFRKTAGPVNTRDWSQWWQFLKGADWRHPYGPASHLDGLGKHPVVHVNYDDALAYAVWAGKDLPTEAEWEYAARGGLDRAPFAWGEHFTPEGRHMANTWQGRFPFENSCEDGWETTSPVRSYPANGYGIFDMIGNTWEWTHDWFVPGHAADAPKACCVPKNPRGPAVGRTDPAAPHIQQRVLKGGSFLCAPSYCQRYRPAARHAEAVDTSTCHVGFRCVKRLKTDLG